MYHQQSFAKGGGGKKKGKCGKAGGKCAESCESGVNPIADANCKREGQVCCPQRKFF